jgi:L,D-transpeptidase catalytic domain
MTETPRRRLVSRAAVFTLGCMAAVAMAGTPPSPAGPRPAVYPQAAVILTPKLVVRARPTSEAAPVKTFRQFRSDFRPTTLLVLGEAEGADGARWLKLSLPMRPNGQTGWVKARALQTWPVRHSIVIDLSARTLRVTEQGRTRFKTRVAIGRPGMETPTGRFYLTATFKPKERYLGAYAFETSAYSKLSEWPGGGIVGLHGTSTPWLLGKRVSHGCVRMANAAALRLKRLTRAGTPLRITA